MAPSLVVCPRQVWFDSAPPCLVSTCGAYNVELVSFCKGHSSSTQISESPCVHFLQLYRSGSSVFSNLLQCNPNLVDWLPWLQGPLLIGRERFVVEDASDWKKTQQLGSFFSNNVSKWSWGVRHQSCRNSLAGNGDGWYNPSCGSPSCRANSFWWWITLVAWECGHLPQRYTSVIRKF